MSLPRAASPRTARPPAVRALCCWPWPRCSVSRCPRCWRRPARPTPRPTATGATTSCTGSTWAFATKGPADTTPKDGAVEGWRFAVGRREHPALPAGHPHLRPTLRRHRRQGRVNKRVGVVDRLRAAGRRRGRRHPARAGRAVRRRRHRRHRAPRCWRPSRRVRGGQGPDLRRQRLPGHRLRRGGQAGQPAAAKAADTPVADRRVRAGASRVAPSTSPSAAGDAAAAGPRRSRAPASRPGPGPASSSSSPCSRSWRSPRCAAAGPERATTSACAAPSPSTACPGCCTRRPGGCGGSAWRRRRPARPTRSCCCWSSRSPRGSCWSAARSARPTCSRAFLVIGLVAIGLRVVTAGLLGGGVDRARGAGPAARGAAARRGPRACAWAAPVTLEGLLAAAYDGLRLAAILACLGAANALASPRRLLRYVPATLYDVGTAVVVALTFAPQMVQDAARVRAARRLRGALEPRPARDRRGWPCRCWRGRWSARWTWPPRWSPAGYGRAVRRTDASRRRRQRADARRAARRPRRALRPARRLHRRRCSACRWSWPARCWPAVALARRRPARDPRRATAATPGRCRSGWCRSPALCRRPSSSSRTAQAWEGIVPGQVPAALPAVPLPAVLAIGCAALAGVVAPVPPQRAAPAGRRGRRPHDRVRTTSASGSTATTATACSRRRLHRPRGRAGPRRRPDRQRASRRCCAASTGWCRTSPAARCSGSVVVDGRDTRTHRPRDLADLVGFVVQDPVASFVTDTVEEEIAYGMEAMGVDADSDAPPGRGDPRPARPAPSCAAARCATSPAASSSGWRSPPCWPPARASSCSTSRPRPWTRWRPRTSSPRCTGWCTTSASPSCWPSTGSSGSSTTPTACVLVDDGARRPAARPGRGDAHLPGLPARRSGWAGPPAGRRCRCRSATRAAGRSACATALGAGASAHPRPPARTGPATPSAACGTWSCARRPVTALRGVDLDVRPRRA